VSNLTVGLPCPDVLIVRNVCDLGSTAQIEASVSESLKGPLRAESQFNTREGESWRFKILMKKLLLAVFATAALAVIFVPSANANSITPYGTFSINYAGQGAVANNTTLANATTVTLQGGVAVGGTPAFYGNAPNIFNGTNTASMTLYSNTLNVTPLSNINNFLTWGPTGDSTQYVFDLTSGTWTSTLVTGFSLLQFTGLGTFMDTSATYANSSASISFSFNQSQPGSAIGGGGSFNVPPYTPAIPEPSSLVLLGTGLLGAAFLLFRRRRTAKSANIA
jgi:hypothetical protein